MECDMGAEWTEAQVGGKVWPILRLLNGLVLATP